MPRKMNACKSSITISKKTTKFFILRKNERKKERMNHSRITFKRNAPFVNRVVIVWYGIFQFDFHVITRFYISADLSLVKSTKSIGTQDKTRFSQSNVCFLYVFTMIATFIISFLHFVCAKWTNLFKSCKDSIAQTSLWIYKIFGPRLLARF